MLASFLINIWEGAVLCAEKNGFTAHSAFEDPTAPADVLPRESIEVRTLVFHNA